MAATEEEDFQLYELREDNGKRHSALRVPRSLPERYFGSSVACATSDVFNILMADISGSMYSFWPHIVTGWKESVQNKLSGHTKIFTFGDLITFKREGTELTQEDFTSDGTNDLTGALRTVRKEVEECKESYVRVFIIADGAHDHGEPYPESEICKMRSPPGKTVSVFILGLGYGFPVQNSIDIRSNMHNGNANIPSLFWAQTDEDIALQLAAIGEELNASTVKVHVNVEGFVIPGLEKTSILHLGEWLYFEQPPEDLASLSASVIDEESLAIAVNALPISTSLLLNDLYRQWTSGLIQQHRRRDPVPLETFDLMESMYSYYLTVLKSSLPSSNDVKSRLGKKNVKALEVEFRTLMNQSKKVISIEGEYHDELELAEAILRTTVTNRKYDTKNLQLKGHSQDDFQEDMETFRKLYEEAKPKIITLPPPTPDDCCRVTITSTLQDLQDPDFHLMLSENKFDFLKSFTATGIPIYAPIRDASQINPWTMVIKHILVTPFTILSQLVLEESANLNKESLGDKDKDVILQQDNDKTRFNAIIPVIPANAAEVLKPIIKSNIYAMMATFCILKNPHIIDHNAHIAALGCAWIRTVREFPKSNRPEFACERLQSIETTANIYMDRPSIQHYIEALISHPNQALMTESLENFHGKTLKCESLVKPAFFMYLKRDKFSVQQVAATLKLLLFEYIGRCLSNYSTQHGKEQPIPFTDFFCPELTDPEKRKAWLEKHCKTVMESFERENGQLLESFFTVDDLVLAVRKYVIRQVSALTDKLLDDLSLSLNVQKVKKLKNFSGCGDIMWSSLWSWAQEMDSPSEVVEELFSPEQISVYVCQALQIKNSRDRLSKDLPTGNVVTDIIKNKVRNENARTLRITIQKEVTELAVKMWREAYFQVHAAVVMPMSPKQVVEGAQARSIQVTMETFRQTYRYSNKTGLLRNACQISDCPHYLHPHNNFNQHLAVERERENFPHALHTISYEFCSQGVKEVIKEAASGKHVGTQGRRCPKPPEASSLESLTDQLENLLKVYSENNNQR